MQLVHVTVERGGAIRGYGKLQVRWEGFNPVDEVFCEVKREGC